MNDLFSYLSKEGFEQIENEFDRKDLKGEELERYRKSLTHDVFQILLKVIAFETGESFTPFFRTRVCESVSQKAIDLGVKSIKEELNLPRKE